MTYVSSMDILNNTIVLHILGFSFYFWSWYKSVSSKEMPSMNSWWCSEWLSISDFTWHQSGGARQVKWALVVLATKMLYKDSILCTFSLLSISGLIFYSDFSNKPKQGSLGCELRTLFSVGADFRPFGPKHTRGRSKRTKQLWCDVTLVYPLLFR